MLLHGERFLQPNQEVNSCVKTRGAESSTGWLHASEQVEEAGRDFLDWTFIDYCICYNKWGSDVRRCTGAVGESRDQVELRTGLRTPSGHTSANYCFWLPVCGVCSPSVPHDGSRRLLFGSRQVRTNSSQGPARP